MRLLRKLSSYPWTMTLLLALLAWGAIAGLRGVGGLQWLELFAFDAMVERQAARGDGPAEIVVLGATEADLNRWGWPLSDDRLADLLERLTALSPRAIGVDIYRHREVPPGRARLERVLRDNDSIIWVDKFGDRPSEAIPPPKVLEGTGRHGFADIVQDPGGIIRRGLLFLDDGKTVSFSFPLRLVLHTLATRGIGPEAGENNYLKLGKTTFVPLDSDFGGYVGADMRGYQFMLDYRVAPSRIRVVPLDALADGKLDADAVKDKIVLIGVTATSVKDFFYTPFSRGGTIDQTTFGVVLHGLIAHQLLRHAIDGAPVLSAPDQRTALLWTLVWAVLGALAARLFRRAIHFTAALSLLIAAIIAISYAGLLLYALWLPLVPAVLAAFLAVVSVGFYLWRMEQSQRGTLMQLFSAHLSPKVAEEIWHSREEFLESGRPRPQRQVASVLFSDIKDFTPVSERLEPPELMDWLNQYLEAMSKLVAEYDGVLDKFSGDGIMALFGVPVARHSEAQIAKDARNAVACALAMGQAVERMNAAWDGTGQPRIGIRVGINTGALVAGCLGSTDKLQYTVIGDTVNIAARLEALGKEVGSAAAPPAPWHILIGEDTADRLGDGFVCEDLGPRALKGKAQTVNVFQVLGAAQPARKAAE